MKMTPQQRIDTCRALCVARYPEYGDFAVGERVLQAMAVLCDVIKVVEVGGDDSGPWIKEMLKLTGLDEGNDWCAAAINFAALVARADVGPNKSPDKADLARVRKWKEWAESTNRSRISPQRGRLAIKKIVKGKGHIGIVARVLPNGDIVTIEGNTSSSNATDGSGLYRVTRKAKFWASFAELDSPAD